MPLSSSQAGTRWSSSASSYRPRSISQVHQYRLARRSLDIHTFGFIAPIRFLIFSSWSNAPPLVLKRSGPFRFASSSSSFALRSTHSCAFDSKGPLLSSSSASLWASTSCSAKRASENESGVMRLAFRHQRLYGAAKPTFIESSESFHRSRSVQESIP